MQELQEIIDDLTEQYTSIQKLLDNTSGNKSFNNMVKSKYRKLVADKRIGMRKSEKGRPLSLVKPIKSMYYSVLKTKLQPMGVNNTVLCI